MHDAYKKRTKNRKEEAHPPLDVAALWERLSAPTRLRVHGQLVAEVAEQLGQLLADCGVPLNPAQVHVGALLHDIGKTLHPEELDAPGAQHEQAGHDLLLREGFSPETAHFCLSHAQHDAMSCSLEELVVALADHLWKGKRSAALELKVIDAVAAATARDRWELFVALDSAFERIAAQSTPRLLRSAAP